jgi:trehalose 6-phosphate phosphatase
MLDFDGTLAPIVSRPEIAELPTEARQALDQLRSRGDVHLAIVSGRALADLRERVGIDGITYAGNHGLEIVGPRVSRLHPEAAAARPHLERAAEELEPLLAEFPGAWLEDKGLTLSLHYRALAEEQVPRLTAAVLERVSRVRGLRLTHGKKVLEVRPKVDWHKGRAVLYLLEELRPPTGTPALYFGDDTTDEDAFVALRDLGGAGAEGILIADPPVLTSAAGSHLRSPAELAQELAALAAGAELPGAPPSG